LIEIFKNLTPHPQSSNMRFSQRLQPLQTNVFADMDRAKGKAKVRGQEIIDLSLGSSDLPTAPHIIAAIQSALVDPSTHGYLLFNGTRLFREAVATWYTNKYGVAIDPETEVLPLVGSQEGTAHLPLAILEPGDVALLMNPGYPSHAGGVYLAGGEIHTMPLLADNGFLPVFADIPAQILARAKMMVLSYPHNPTTAIAPLSFFQEAVAFCQHHDLVLVHDFPYGDMVFSELPAPSILQADRVKSVAIEFFTMSKSYNMGGFRIGYAIGNRDLIRALRQIKAVVDFNQYSGILHGAVTALNSDQLCVQTTVNTFKQRRDTFVQALEQIGWQVPTPAATMYIWAKLPPQWARNSIEFCTELVAQTGVAASPGVGFGTCGEGYVRFALVRESDVLEQAVARLAKFL
jgi:aspartate/methionine/tyrosine aminotransferase